MPLSPLNDNNDHAHTSYQTLLAHLNPSPPLVLEIDILPSSSGPDIQYSSTDHALGIPKRTLIAAFLVARGLFFTYLSSLGHGSISAGEDEGGDKGEEMMQATSVMLLYEPNHGTAINARKRYILSHFHRPSSSVAGSSDDDVVVNGELIWLESYLTSPLPKHTKSPTLWAHRAWLLRLFVIPGLGDSVPGLQGKRKQGISDDGRRLLEREMDVVMRAGERHPRNYYGWNYAREVCGMLGGEVLDKEEEAFDGSLGSGAGWGMVEKVRGWCFLHPRDVSGWSFLVWWLEDWMKMSGCVGRGEDMVEDIVMETEAFVAKYEWRGESIEWFLKAIRRLQTSG
ncbi:MAG: hypothetical protein OHK93_006475 [Ramalina farinacea]|uniref:Uncharacterized protein n=1 Tax=Ramalina farinacea TaxID=258253 RepID=A0AA43QIM2_9LECA|nr:hypothetical protein [Ramalina farinacea]